MRNDIELASQIFAYCADFRSLHDYIVPTIPCCAEVPFHCLNLCITDKADNKVQQDLCAALQAMVAFASLLIVEGFKGGPGLVFGGGPPPTI